MSPRSTLELPAEPDPPSVPPAIPPSISWPFLAVGGLWALALLTTLIPFFLLGLYPADRYHLERSLICAFAAFTLAALGQLIRRSARGTDPPITLSRPQWSVLITILIIAAFFSGRAFSFLLDRPDTPPSNPLAIAPPPNAPADEAPTQPEKPTRLPLIPVEGFTDATFASHWSPQTEGKGTVTLDAGRILLDMPENPNPGNRAQCIYNGVALRLTRPGQSVRVTWDMRILEDRVNAFYNGLALGTPEGKQIFVGQAGRKNDDPSMGRPHELKISGAADDGIDHGTEPLHYDLTVTLENVWTGAVRLDLLAFPRDSDLNRDPDGYVARMQPISKMTGIGSLLVDADIGLFLFVERADILGDIYPAQPCAKIAIWNLYTSGLKP